MTHRLFWILLTVVPALQLACAEESLPPYVPVLNAGDAATDGSAADGGASGNGPQVGISMQEMVDDLQAWGADIGDQDKICANIDHSCAIDMQGRAKCWGSGTHDGEKAAPPEGLAPLVQITCGEFHTCALDENGKITCWGEGSTKERIGESSREQGQSIVPAGTYKEVSARGVFTCAIDMSDHIVCWGAGSPDSEPVFPDFGQSSPPKGTYKGISAGEAHACAIALATGNVVCWGAGMTDAGCFPNQNYECGQAEGESGAFIEVASGEQHSCALRKDGTVACWGVGKTGEKCDVTAGDNSYDCGQALPPDDPKIRFTKLRSGWLYTCGITEDYVLKCWGWKDIGVTKVPPGQYSQVAAGGNKHVCAINLEGQVACWGRDSGNGETKVPDNVTGK